MEQLKPLLYSTAVVARPVGDWSEADNITTIGQFATSGQLDHWSINVLDRGCDGITKTPSSEKKTY